MGNDLVDSADFVAEFRALAEKETPETNRNWDQDGGLLFYGDIDESGIGRWSPLQGPSEVFLAEFINIATRAGIVLGSPVGVNPCDYFLDCVYNELREKDSRFACRTVPKASLSDFGRIFRVCEAATTFWIWRKTIAEQGKYGFEMQSKVEGPDVRVTWDPYSTGGILLFRNEGTEAAKNVRLHCSIEIGWRPVLSPQVVASIPPGGHFRAIDITKYAREGEDFWATTDGQSIAEFVHSLPRSSMPFTMTVVFEDRLGVERAKDFRVLTAGWMGYTNVKIQMAPRESPSPIASGNIDSSDSGLGIAFESVGAVSDDNASSGAVRQHGFKPDIDRHRSIAQIVGRHDEGWKDGSMRWRKEAILAKICKGLDRDDVDFPQTWKTGKTAPLKGAPAKSWLDALQLGLKKSVTDQIRYSLKMVMKPSNRRED